MSVTVGQPDRSDYPASWGSIMCLLCEFENAVSFAETNRFRRKTRGETWGVWNESEDDLVVEELRETLARAIAARLRLSCESSDVPPVEGVTSDTIYR